MLASGNNDRQISNVGCSGGSCDDIDDEDDAAGRDGVQCRHNDDENGKKQRLYGCSGLVRDFGKAKQSILYPLSKAKTLLHQRKSKRGSSVTVQRKDVSSLGERTIVDCSFNKGCSCFAQLQTLKSRDGTQTSDPNDPNFTYEMLKALIESNDFYAKECNPHSDNNPFSSDTT